MRAFLQLRRVRRLPLGDDTVTAAARAAGPGAGLLLCLAALAHAQPQGPAGGVHLLHVQKNVYMLTSSVGNTTVQVGDDGVLLVDTQTADLAPQVMAAIRTISPRPVHTIIDTHVHADHTGGNDALVKLRGAAGPAVRIIAHDEVLTRMTAAASAAPGGIRLNAVIVVPINSTYVTPSRDFFLNGESIVLYHAPRAHTDGDSLVHFRGSDVVAVGDVFRPDVYPFIDVANGGSVQGLIEALNHVLELTVPAKYQEGGTYVIPGHGRLCDEADVVEYRDMVTIVRDRVQDLISKGMSLQQVVAARPSRDYDPEYGGTGESSPDRFVEAVYRSLAPK
jgi:glyoxylase-like metal-dependent hydrolase (beta-lactamase superfamily II)